MSFISNAVSKLQRKFSSSNKSGPKLREDPMMASVSTELRSNPLRISVYPANGGVVVETRQYNKVTDEEHTQLHVITDTEDLGNRLSQIITLESLRTR